MADRFGRVKAGASRGAAVAWPLAARAQQPGKLPIIGFLGANTPSVQSHWIAAFVQRLRELGWIEGRNVAIEYRWAETRFERSPEIIAEFGLSSSDRHSSCHAHAHARPRPQVFSRLGRSGL